MLANRSRVIYHSQDFFEPGRHPVWTFFEKRLARRAGHVICNEPNRARFMASHYRLREMPTVVRTALPKDWPLPEFDPAVRGSILEKIGRQNDKTCCLVLNQGSFSPVRCSQQLMEAFTVLDERYVLVLTGTVPGSESEKTGRRVARELGIEGRTVFLERLPFSELLRHSAACDVAILLYPNDGVGNFYQSPGRLTEYIGCGLPIVTSHFPGLELLTLKHNLGHTCDPDSPEDIAQAIRKLGNRSSEETLSERKRLRNLAKTEFAYETQAWQIEKIVRKLIQQN